jgi:Protein of unknown function (DUF3383)
MSIPMSQIIGSVPSVLGTGGNPLSPNGVFLTTDPSIPVNMAQGFTDDELVEDWFGPNAPETLLAQDYFAGFIGATSLPSVLYFWQYNQNAVAAYLRSASLSNVSLTSLQAFSGDLIVSVDGRTLTSAAINLASATSYANAATLIQTGLQTVGNSWTGTLSVATSETVTIDSTTTGILHVGDVLVGTDIPVNATITAFGTYTTTAGTGTVTISAAATGTAGPEAGTVTYLPTVTYDALRQAFLITSPTTGATSSVGYASGTLSADLLLTQVTGAALSDGAAAATPSSSMNSLIQATQNFVTFMTVFDLTDDVTTALGFAEWVSTVTTAGSQRFMFVEWDSNAAEAAGPAAESFGAQLVAAEFNGTMPWYDLTEGAKAAFTCGAFACLDTTQANGRITMCFKGQAGLVPDVTDSDTAANLAGVPYGSGGNGYNFYGDFATSAQQFQWAIPGSMPGVWKWADAYFNQILMNADFQLALATLASNVPSIPYNTAGYTLVRGALAPVITKYLNWGAIQPNVPLSASQIQQVNTAAGANIGGTLSTVGYYLQILPASAQVRGVRGSPPMKFWYTDGGSIQSLLLASIDVQ